MIFKKSSIILVTALLQACSGSLDDVRNNLDGNASPIVNTTINTNVAVGVQTSLTATATDPDGDTLQYLWSITGLPTGSTTTLANANQPVSTFTPDLEGSYTTRLVVDDGINKVTRTATIQAILGNIAPTASIANPPTAALNSTVQLNGNNSTDPNNDTLSYRWTFQYRPTNSQAVFNFTNAAQPSFTADVGGDYQVQLIVNDGEFDSIPATAIVTASGGNGNASPIVNTTINTRAAVGVITSLTATATDPDGDTLQYLWSIIDVPGGSTATLATANQPVATFTPDLKGSYTVQVAVSDGTNEVTRTATIQAAQAATVGASVVGVTIESTSGGEQSTVPVTFGQVFKPGEILENTLLSVRLTDGTQELIPSQINKKATHADGSLRHAVVTALVPTLTPNNPQDIEIVVVDSVPTTQPVRLADLLTTNFDGHVSLTVAGTAYTASITDLLQNAQPETWLSGSEVTEWIVSAPLKTANGTEHPHLTARFNVRAYAGFNSIRVDIIIENNWSYVPEPQNFVYDVNVSLCGKDIYSKTGLVHYHHARWRKTFWCGNEPEIHVKHDIDYLIDSYAVSNFDRSLVIPEADLSDMGADWIGPKTEPMGIGLARPYMPGGGASPDIGPLPRWATRYLLSQDIRAKISMLGTANLAGSWSIHYRDKSTDLPISIEDYPYMTLMCSYGNTRNPDTGEYEAFPDFGGDSTTPYTADDAHQPDLVYLPYLVTGDHYFLEELHFWANYNMLRACPGDGGRSHDAGLVKSAQLRGQAWSMRTLGETAFITPDNHIYKRYFVEKLDNNLTWYNDNYTNNPSTNNLGILTNGYALNNGPNILPWQDDFFTWSIGHLAEMGFTKATDLLTWKSTFSIGRMTNPEYCWVFGSLFPLQVRNDNTSPIYSTFGEVYRTSVEPQYLTMTCAGQEMADALGLEPGSMVGYPHAATGYPANLQPALAAAVDSSSQGAAEAWAIFEGRSVKPKGSKSYDRYPNYAIIPRP